MVMVMVPTEFGLATPNLQVAIKIEVFISLISQIKNWKIELKLNWVFSIKQWPFITLITPSNHYCPIVWAWAVNLPSRPSEVLTFFNGNIVRDGDDDGDAICFSKVFENIFELANFDQRHFQLFVFGWGKKILVLIIFLRCFFEKDINLPIIFFKWLSVLSSLYNQIISSFMVFFSLNEKFGM